MLRLAFWPLLASDISAIGILDFWPFLFQKGFHSNVSCYKTSGACQPFGLCWLLTLAKAKMKAAKKDPRSNKKKIFALTIRILFQM